MPATGDIAMHEQMPRQLCVGDVSVTDDDAEYDVYSFWPSYSPNIIFPDDPNAVYTIVYRISRAYNWMFGSSSRPSYLTGMSCVTLVCLLYISHAVLSNNADIQFSHFHHRTR